MGGGTKIPSQPPSCAPRACAQAAHNHSRKGSRFSSNAEVGKLISKPFLPSTSGCSSPMMPMVRPSITMWACMPVMNDGSSLGTSLKVLLLEPSTCSCSGSAFSANISWSSAPCSRENWLCDAAWHAAMRLTFLDPTSRVGSWRTTSPTSNNLTGSSWPLLAARVFKSPGRTEVLTISNSLVLGSFTDTGTGKGTYSWGLEVIRHSSSTFSSCLICWKHSFREMSAQFRHSMKPAIAISTRTWSLRWFTGCSAAPAKVIGTSRCRLL
mmetsp:Transcript_52028/g.137444  ORF Transcript_52028/g.137444 Transcript_52028/m.137444 type:complete len:267 (+) Transcript_52028:78-878(+)